MAPPHADRAVSEVKDTVGDVQASPAYRALVRVGLVAYGVVHLLIAYLAVRVATGTSAGQEDASNTGALAQVADAPAGTILLWIVAVGLATISIWQLLEALTGHREFDDKKRLQKRISSGIRFITYGVIAVTALKFLLGSPSGSGGDTEEGASRSILDLPGGRFIVLAIGLAIIGYGVYYVYKGVKDKYNEDLTTELSGAARAVARVGCVAKGVAYGVMGGLFAWAGLTHDAEKAGGLDDALATIANQPMGTALLLAVALGLACYGIYCFFWAKHAKVSQMS